MAGLASRVSHWHSQPQSIGDDVHGAAKGSKLDMALRVMVVDADAGEDAVAVVEHAGISEGVL